MKSNATVLLLSATVYPALLAAVVVSIEPSATWCQDFVSYAQHLNIYIALHLEDTTDGYHCDFCRFNEDKFCQQKALVFQYLPNKDVS